MNLAGYIRVSTEGQVDAYGKDVQRKHIVDWSALNSHNVVEWFEEDAVSGKTEGGDRPVLREILERSDEFDGVVFFDATRIARRSVVQETLLGLIWASGLTVFTTTAGELEADENDPTKILIRQILGVVAEFEHRSLVIKLHAARKVKASRGGYVGGTPRFGLAVTGSGKTAQFVPDEVESEVIEGIVSLKGCGFSLRQIAGHLNNQHIPTKTGKAWMAPQVQRILQRYESEQAQVVRAATC